jgi:acyl-CoA synthetase (AMP-forming)/AMP-acid ligase II
VIKSSGTNVTPREVELVIEAQPDVMHAFVAAVPHPDRGEDVAAAVVARPGIAIDPEDLRARLKVELSSYKVPRHIAVLATAADLPWLDSGKVDLRGVQRLLVDRFGT